MDYCDQEKCTPPNGRLPGKCAPLAFPYVPVQEKAPPVLPQMEALETGTLFPGLDLPFKAAMQNPGKLENTALAELMAVDFAVTELGLYLDTHREDREALQLYRQYVALSREGRDAYQKRFGPLVSTEQISPEDYTWTDDPWPWDLGGEH